MWRLSYYNVFNRPLSDVAVTVSREYQTISTLAGVWRIGFPHDSCATPMQGNKQRTSIVNNQNETCQT